MNKKEDKQNLVSGALMAGLTGLLIYSCEPTHKKETDFEHRQEPLVKKIDRMYKMYKLTDELIPVQTQDDFYIEFVPKQELKEHLEHYKKRMKYTKVNKK